MSSQKEIVCLQIGGNAKHWEVFNSRDKHIPGYKTPIDGNVYVYREDMEHVRKLIREWLDQDEGTKDMEFCYEDTYSIHLMQKE